MIRVACARGAPHPQVGHEHVHVEEVEAARRVLQHLRHAEIDLGAELDEHRQPLGTQALEELSRGVELLEGIVTGRGELEDLEVSPQLVLEQGTIEAVRRATRADDQQRRSIASIRSLELGDQWIERACSLDARVLVDGVDDRVQAECGQRDRTADGNSDGASWQPHRQESRDHQEQRDADPHPPANRRRELGELEGRPTRKHRRVITRVVAEPLDRGRSFH